MNKFILGDKTSYYDIISIILIIAAYIISYPDALNNIKNILTHKTISVKS